MRKHSSNQYSFTTLQDGPNWHSYQVAQVYPSYRLLEGGWARSRRAAADMARASIAALEAGEHFTQQVESPASTLNRHHP